MVVILYCVTFNTWLYANLQGIATSFQLEIEKFDQLHLYASFSNACL